MKWKCCMTVWMFIMICLPLVKDTSSSVVRYGVDEEVFFGIIRSKCKHNITSLQLRLYDMASRNLVNIASARRSGANILPEPIMTYEQAAVRFKAKYGYFISRNTLKDVQYWLFCSCVYVLKFTAQYTWTPSPEPMEACDRFHGEYMPSLQYSQWTYNDTQVLIELRRITSTGGKEGPRRAFTWRSI